MRKKFALSIGVGAALLLFTGVASAEAGMLLTTEEMDFFTQLLHIVYDFVEELKGLPDMQS